MATVNKRVSTPQATTINGIDVGGVMTANLSNGYDSKAKSAPDGLGGPSLKDKYGAFVRGSITTQDWATMISLLTGTLDTYVFYERKSGVAEATGYIKHTITNPVIHSVSMSIQSGGNNTTYATVTFEFECKAADETKDIEDMWPQEDSQAKPTYISAARGGLRIVSAIHGTGVDEINLYHATGFSFSIKLPLFKESNDGDVGYTCVDARTEGMQCQGSVNFQDASIVAAQDVATQLVKATAAALVLTVRQGQGAASKLITINGVDFDNASRSPSAQAPYTGMAANFDLANNTTTPLSIAGTTKIITIADVA